MERILYTRQEAAALLSINVRQLDRYIWMKEIAARRIGRRVLIHRQVIEQFARHDHASPGQAAGTKLEVVS